MGVSPDKTVYSLLIFNLFLRKLLCLRSPTFLHMHIMIESEYYNQMLLQHFDVYLNDLNDIIWLVYYI